MDKDKIAALVAAVLAWNLSSRDRQQPAAAIVEDSIEQLSRYVKALGNSLAAHVHALPPGDDIRRRAVVTLDEASRRLQATHQSKGNALRAQKLARLVQSLNAVTEAAEKRVQHHLTVRAARRNATPAPERGWP
ncbi:DUF6415 family natural product biosynthesis protein [Streptomyces sp. NPDC003016]